MNKIFKIAVLTSIVLLYSCKNFETMTLDDSDKLALTTDKEVGIPILAYNKGMIDNFKEDINYWWVANDKVGIVKKGDTLRVKLTNVGMKYECWGREFEMCDFTEAPVLKVRARFEGKSSPTLSPHLKDVNGYDANFAPPSARIKKGDYQDYYFNFTGKWKQSWPDDKVVDFTAIREILFFVNPGAADWTGTLYIDDIQAVKISDIPAKKSPTSAVTPDSNTTAPVSTETTPVSTETKTTTTTTTKTKTTPVEETKATPVEGTKVITEESKKPVSTVNAASVLIDDFKGNIKSWRTGSDKISLSKKDDMLNVDMKNVGPSYETFGRAFKSIDFEKTPVVKVRMKASGEKPAVLRVDIKDSEGFTTNSKPNTMKFESGTDFVDYYYDFTSKFEQTFPMVKTVNPSGIVEIVFFVNPGGEAYSGTLLIDEVKVLSLEDYKNKK
jgi:hypothetical protein